MDSLICTLARFKLSRNLIDPRLWRPRFLLALNCFVLASLVYKAAYQVKQSSKLQQEINVIESKFKELHHVNLKLRYEHFNTFEPFEKKKALVVGGAGFIGSHVVEHLLSFGMEVAIIDDLSTGRRENFQEFRMKVKFYEFDISDTKKLLNFVKFEERFDYIYHFASSDSTSNVHPMKLYDSIYLGTYNLLHLAEAMNATLLFASSSYIYGCLDDKLKYFGYEDDGFFVESDSGYVNSFDEHAMLNEGMRTAEVLIRTYHNERRNFPKPKIARIFETYGPKSSRGIIFKLIQAACDKTTEKMIVNLDGKQSLTFLYIDDLIAGLIKFLNSDETLLNFGDNKRKSIKEVAEVLKSLISSKFKQLKNKEHIVFNASSIGKMPRQVLASIEKARETLSWIPKQDKFKEKLSKTIEYFISHEQKI